MEIQFLSAVKLAEYNNRWRGQKTLRKVVSYRVNGLLPTGTLINGNGKKRVYGVKTFLKIFNFTRFTVKTVNPRKPGG